MGSPTLARRPAARRTSLLVLVLNLPLLLFVLILSHVPTASTTGCFKADGSTSHDDEWPCDPDADTSLCCGATDYCLGSVMCLDTGADNMLSLQGCTNSSWPEACNPMCPGTTADGYIYLQQCSSSSGTTQVCCGTDYSCCNGTEVVDINHFTAISRAPGATSTASSTAGATGSATSSASSSTSTSSNNSSSSGSSNNDDDTRSLAVGLGVGIPLGLAFIAALVFLGLQLRKRNAARAPPAAQTSLQQEQTAQLYAHGAGAGDWQQHQQRLAWMGPQEMQAYRKPNELQGERLAHEVPG